MENKDYIDVELNNVSVVVKLGVPNWDNEKLQDAVKIIRSVFGEGCQVRNSDITPEKVEVTQGTPDNRSHPAHKDHHKTYYDFPSGEHMLTSGPKQMKGCHLKHLSAEQVLQEFSFSKESFNEIDREAIKAYKKDYLAAKKKVEADQSAVEQIPFDDDDIAF